MTDPSSKHFVLATDLDGTFLGGSERNRRALYDWIENERDTVSLVFVTGRDPDFILELTADGSVPTPDFVIGDVGTSVYHMRPDRVLEPDADLEAPIVRAWNDAGARVREALDGAAGLTLQPTPFRHRVSYDLDPEHYDPSAEARVTDMGFDALVSDNRFFDVLPRGVSKGPTLLRFVDRFGLSRGSVLAAGDTMNDLSMLVSGLPAAVVGGAEAGLLAATRDVASARHCTSIGAGGIIETIRALNLHPSPPGDPE